MTTYDAIVVGSGPNGLSAAIVLAKAGLSVLVREAQSTIGGSARTLELTLPGFHHDIGSAIHPMAVASPFFCSLSLDCYGLEWIQPPAAVAHPLDVEPPAMLERSLDASLSTLSPDQSNYRRLLQPLLADWQSLISEILAPPLHLPSHPFAMLNFGWHAIFSAAALNRLCFRGERARALFAGLASHSITSLELAGSSAIGLVMAITAHAVGWPLPRGGSQQIANALAACLRSHGGVIETCAPVEDIDELPAARAVLFDLSPRQILRIARRRLPANFARRLDRFAYGPGVFKIDWALSEPVPWRHDECRRTATLHLGGSANEIRSSEADSWNGKLSARPWVLFAQQSLFDNSRAPQGKHTGWAYCHVPHGSLEDRTAAIEAQVERFAPGFRDCILARSSKNTAAMEHLNPNLIGGDIGGGANNLVQLLRRPVFSSDPYRLPADGLYLCSASTPPGGGVHGMCGYHAARSALKHTFGISELSHSG
jgi:phytoene dehydrogenase-like protein